MYKLYNYIYFLIIIFSSVYMGCGTIDKDTPIRAMCCSKHYTDIESATPKYAQVPQLNKISRHLQTLIREDKTEQAIETLKLFSPGSKEEAAFLLDALVTPRHRSPISLGKWLIQDPLISQRLIDELIESQNNLTAIVLVKIILKEYKSEASSYLPDKVQKKNILHVVKRHYTVNGSEHVKEESYSHILKQQPMICETAYNKEETFLYLPHWLRLQKQHLLATNLARYRYNPQQLLKDHEVEDMLIDRCYCCFPSALADEVSESLNTSKESRWSCVCTGWYHAVFCSALVASFMCMPCACAMAPKWTLCEKIFEKHTNLKPPIEIPYIFGRKWGI